MQMKVTIEILRAIYRAGIKAVEYTSRESALSNFTKMVAVRNVEMPDLLGIGTIKTQEYCWS
jgi:2-dehydro-3-deoxyphosphogluconate aldolase/(4S)-4-hydroxy-2-oxoglutarate aldolase